MNVNSGIKFDANLINIDSVMDNCFCKKAIFLSWLQGKLLM